MKLSIRIQHGGLAADAWRCSLGQTSTPENRAVRFIPELDGLRGIAITLVVLIHARPWPAGWFAPFPFLFDALTIGSTGVDFFFVISGFLITTILLNTKDASPRFYFWSFYARRILRIFPLYIFAVGAFFYGWLPFVQSHGANLEVSSSEQIWYWMYLSNWRDALGHIIPDVGHFWSLGVEEQFYLIWPIVVFFCAARYFPALCVGMGAFSLVLRVILCTGHYIQPDLLGEFIHRVTITRLDTLAVGALIAVLVRNPNLAKQVRAQIKVIAPAAFGAFLLIWLAGQQGFSIPLNTFGYLASALAYGSVVFVCVTDQGSGHPLCRFARWRPLRSIGHYSYAIYVLHLFVLKVLREHVFTPVLERIRGAHTIVPPIVPAFIILGVSLALAYCAALVSWHLLEKHFLLLKKYFPYQVASPRPSSGCRTEETELRQDVLSRTSI